MHRASIDRTYILRSLLLAGLLLWPLFVMGKPSYMLDSAYYQNGGKTAITFVAKKLHIPLEEAAPQSPAAAKAAKAEDSKIVARSIIYSVLGFLLSGPGMTMMYLAAFQAACTSLVVNALFPVLAGPSRRAFMTMAGVMLLGTGLAPIVNFMVPDIFAGLMMGVLAVLPFYWRRFSSGLLFLVLMIAIASITMHASIPPVAAGTAFLASFVIVLMRRQGRRWARRTGLAVLWLPVVAGVAVTMGTGLIGFGEASIAPKGFPLALARGLRNGPARWYLQDECRERPKSFAMCEIYGTDPPDDVDEFLFKPGNVVNRATPEQLDRIRAEEKTIVINSTLRYPWYQVYVASRDVPNQFASIELTYLRYDGEIVRQPNGKAMLRKADDNSPEAQSPPVIILLSYLSEVVVLLSAGLLAWRWRRLSLDQRAVVLAVLVGLVANAAVCAIFSGVAPRYQARIIWLVPFLAIAFARNWNEAETSSEGEARA